MNQKKFLLITTAIALTTFLSFYFLNKQNSIPQESRQRIPLEQLVQVHSPIKGPAKAPITIVEFLDPECEACRAMHPIVKHLMSEYEGKVRLVIRYLPLHQNSTYASAAIEEARTQNKFEEALDTLFANQPEWGNHHNPRPELILQFLENIGISKASLDKDTILAKHQSKIEIDKQDAIRLGIKATPTFFVNGIMLEQIGYQAIKSAIDAELAQLKK